MRSARNTASASECVTNTIVLPVRASRIGKVFAQHHAGLLVERRERLVEQQYLGADAKPARKIDALLHAAGKLFRVVIGELRHVDRGERLHRAVAPAGVVDALEFERQAEILDHRVPGQQRALLEHKAMSFGRGPFTGAPSTVTEPAVASSIPPIMASSVLLPQPEGPSRQTNSPWPISSETSSSACTSARRRPGERHRHVVDRDHRRDERRSRRDFP